MNEWMNVTHYRVLWKRHGGEGDPYRCRCSCLRMNERTNEQTNKRTNEWMNVNNIKCKQYYSLSDLVVGAWRREQSLSRLLLPPPNEGRNQWTDKQTNEPMKECLLMYITHYGILWKSPVAASASVLLMNEWMNEWMILTIGSCGRGMDDKAIPIAVAAAASVPFSCTEM